MMQIFSDEYFMKIALQEAKIALEKGEVPIGAVIVFENKVIAKAHNLTETLNDVTAHAEMQAITAAANVLGGKYLKKCVLYVTTEPCIMCGGAIGWSQLAKVVYGAGDNKKGFSGYSPNVLHPKTEVIAGVLKDDCASLLINFFKQKR